MALKDEEDILLDFALHLQRLGHSESSIRSALFGIRFHHIAQGAPYPLVGRPRLWMLMKSIKRKAPGTKRKYPVTAKMFRHITKYLSSNEPKHAQLRAVPKIDTVDANALWARIVTAWMFLLRGGEWLAHNGRGYDTSNVILGNGVMMRK